MIIFHAFGVQDNLIRQPLQGSVHSEAPGTLGVHTVALASHVGYTTKVPNLVRAVVPFHVPARHGHT